MFGFSLLNGFLQIVISALLIFLTSFVWVLIIHVYRPFSIHFLTILHKYLWLRSSSLFLGLDGPGPGLEGQGLGLQGPMALRLSL